MKIIKNKKKDVCKLCDLKIESDSKVEILAPSNFRRGMYYHLNCYYDILNNTFKSLTKDKKDYWNRLKMFNNLQKEMEEERKIMKKQRIIEGLE